MATQDDGWTVVAPASTKTTSSKDDWTVVAPAKTNVTSSKSEAKSALNQDPVSRLATHVGRTGVEAVVPTGAGLAGFGAGMAMAAPVAATVAPLTGPFAPFVAGAIELGGGFGGAMAASGSAKWMQDLMHKTFAPEDFAQREAEKKEYPTATFLTELSVGMAGMSPKTAATVAKEGAGKIARLASTPVGQRVVSGGLQGGIEAGTELAGEGKIEPWKVATATAAGAAMPGFNVAGKIPFSVGTKIGEKISDKLRGIKPTTTTVDPLPPRPPEGATAEEKAAYIQKLEAIKAERDAKAPLTEAGMKNTKTNEELRMGPKHDQAKKEELKTNSDWQEGFFDERGNFHERQDAVDQAKRSGQLPEDHVLESPPDERPGLHSGDMRKVGDERFAITEDQPAGVPHKPFKDLSAPTGEELYKHLSSAKTVGEAYDRLLSVESLGTKPERALLKLLANYDFIRNADFHFGDTPLMVGDKPARGAYGVDGRHLISMDKTGDLGTMIHEGFHAGTVKLMLEGKHAAARKLDDLYVDFMEAHFEPELAKLYAEHEFSTGKTLSVKQKAELREQFLDSKPYGFKNSREFISEAFVDSKMRELLMSMPSKGKDGVLSNLWQDIKNTIAEHFGIKGEERTAFDDMMDRTQELLETSKGYDKLLDAPTSVVASRLSQEIQDDLQRQGIAVAHSSPHKFGMFDWIKHALSGEGFMAFGAGSYHSTADATDRGYFKMAKDQLRNKLFEQNPELKDKYYYLKNDVDWKERQVDLADDRLKEFQQGDLAKAEYEARRTYEQYVQDVYDWHPDVDATDPMVRKMYEREIALSKQALENVKQKEKTLEKVVNDRKIQAEQAAKEFSDLQTEVTNATKAATYHSTIKAKPEELLDWNATKQSNLVNNVFEKLGVELETERLVWTKTGEDRYTATNKNGQELFLGRQDAGTEKGWYVVDAATGELLKTAVTLEDAKSATKTGEQLYRELSKLFEPFGEGRAYLTDEEASHIGDVKASIALAEQGVAGNVHDAQGGTESKHRNYVVFDDTKLKTNFVGLAQRPKTTSSPDELPVDRTKTDPRDVKDEKEFYEIATDIYEKYGDTDAVKFYEGYKEYKQTWLEPIKETEKFVGINIKNKLANDRIIHNEMTKMAEAITDPARREAIAEAVDKGDLSGLTPEETALAKKYEALVKDIGDRAVEQGVVKGLLEDYVTHILDWAGAPKGAREEFIQTLLGTAPRDPSMRGMTTESKFGKERKFKTFADLEWFINEANGRIAAAGKSDFRLKIKTKDIAEIYKEYATSMEKAIENKKLVDNLKQVRNVAGETLIKEVNKDNPMPYGWEMMDSPQFAGYAVHPDMMPALKFVFDAGPGDLMKAFGAISQLTKRINVIGSFFHAKSLMEVLSSSQIPIWTPVKEAIVLPLIEKGVKAITGKELQLSAISKAVEQFKNGGVGDNVDMWIKDGGLQLEMPEDVTQGILSATGKFADSMIGKYGPKTRVLESVMSTVEKYTLGLFDKYTWNYLHTGGKLMVADAYLDKARMTAAKEGKPFDEAASRKEISKFVNDSFGGLNWFDAATQTQNEFAKRIAMAAYNPAGRRGLQVALFAPDWTLSTLRAFTAALPKELNPAKWHPVEGVKGMMTPTTKADYARLYQFKTALTYFTLINAINMMTADRPIWENKDPTRIEWPDGTSMQAMKHAMEPYHWLMDADKTFANKLGFIPKAVIVGVAGTEYASPQAQKLVDPSATGRLKAVAGMVVPFQVAASRDAPPGEGAKRAAFGTMGFPIYGSTPEQKKASRAEREKQLKEAAKKYHIKAKEKGWEK